MADDPKPKRVTEELHRALDAIEKARVDLTEIELCIALGTYIMVTIAERRGEVLAAQVAGDLFASILQSYAATREITKEKVTVH